MRHDVATPSYLFRRAIDNILHALTSPTASSKSPSALVQGPEDSSELTYTKPKGENSLGAAFEAEPFGWLPLYTMVTFRPHLGYAAAQRRAQRQDRILLFLEGVATVGTVAAVSWAAWVMKNRLR
jgi:kynurenine 3-monooxygenase